VRPTETTDRPRPWRLLVVGCLALAALSLLGPSRPTYDPWSWLIWGREVAHLDLVTTDGPSWKPLPVAFTTVFSLSGDGAAPLLWLLIARSGGLLAIAMAYRLASRLAGTAAGVIAAVSLVLANDFVDSFARGNSEGLLVALTLWAIERHLDRRYGDAFLLGVAAALLRPETWPFLALYGLWLIQRDWRRPNRTQTTALVVGAGILVLALWLVPEYIGSGSLLRGASRAREPVAGSPAQTAVPFLAVFDNGSSALSWPIYVGAVVAAAFAVGAYLRDRRITVVLALGAVATALMIIVGLLAQAGFTGNLRYVTLPAAILCVVGGVGWAQLITAVRGRHGRGAALAVGVAAATASIPFVVGDLPRLDDQLDNLRRAARISAALPDAISRAGGVQAVRRCRPVYTRTVNVPLVAWELHLHENEVGNRPRPPGTVIVTGESREASDPRFRSLAQTRQWTVASTCPSGG